MAYLLYFTSIAETVTKLDNSASWHDKRPMNVPFLKTIILKSYLQSPNERFVGQLPYVYTGPTRLASTPHVRPL